LNAGAATIDGEGKYRGPFVQSGKITVDGLTIADAGAAGGNGGAGIAGGGFGTSASGSRGPNVTTSVGDAPGRSGGGGQVQPVIDMYAFKMLPRNPFAGVDS
jgi:hypothetical protein